MSCQDEREQLLVSVLYDFEYQASDSRWIWMKEGEKLTVLTQTNEDWWQVIRNGDKETPFYAPTSYLQTCSDENLDSGIADVSIEDKIKDVHISASSSDCKIEELAVDKEQRSPSIYENPIYSNVKLLVSKPSVEIDEECEAQNVDNPIYANFPLHALSLEEIPEPNSKQSPSKILLNHWAEYIDDQNRKFYFNSVTGQSSWKPPRRRLDRPHASSTSSQSDGKESFPNDSPTILKRTSLFYDQLPQDESLSAEKSSKGHLAIKEKQRNKSDSHLNKNSSSTENLTVDKKLHVWKSSPSLMRKLKKSIRGSPLLGRRKVVNNNDEKVCASAACANSDATPHVIMNPKCSSTDASGGDTKRDKQFIVPKGWTQAKGNDGIVCFIHVKSGQKWQCSVDDSGRDYYYKVNGTESFWELPDIECPDNKEPPEKYPSLPSSLKPVSQPRVPVINKFASLDRDTKTRSLIINPDCNLRSTSTGDLGSIGDGKSVTLPRGSELFDTKPHWADLKDVIREGHLNKTKVMECGKRKRKDWMTSFVVLTSSRLIFYKDARTPTSKQPPSKPEKAEMNLDLCGSVIDWCPEKSSRKNVFQINTVLGVLILFQDDDAELMNNWFADIKSVIAKLPALFPVGHVVKSSSLENDIHTSAEKTSKMSRSKSAKFIKTAAASSDQIEGVTSAAEKKKIKKKLKNFFQRRPTFESLEEKGIIQDERVFGCNLVQLCNREATTIPRFVQECIGAIEQRDMKADGLYRASGNISQIQKIRFQVNQDIFTGVHMEEDVHVLSGCLKMFFRHMKEPLIPANVYDKLLVAIKIRSKDDRLQKIKEYLRLLQKPNFHTLKFLLQHLLRVTKFSHFNRMYVRNLAIVFGPTIMGADSVSDDLALDMMYQNQIIEFLLLEFDAVYADHS